MSADTLTLTILAVDCPLRGQAEDMRVLRVATGREAMLTLRATPIDLLVTTSDVDGGAIWPLAEKVRRLRPKLRWWLVARGLDAGGEVRARTLGVTRILSAPPQLDAIRFHDARAGPIADAGLPPRPGWIDLETVRASP